MFISCFMITKDGFTIGTSEIRTRDLLFTRQAL